MKWFLALWGIGLVLTPGQIAQDVSERRAECLDICMRERPNPDLQREEVTALERETARAIQLKNPAFFNRVYSDDFSGISSRGEAINKAALLAALQAPDVTYESFTASRIKVRIYRDTAVATSLWSIRSVLKEQHIGSQLQVTHIYVYGPSGYQVVSSQTTLMPPYISLPL